MSDARIVFIGGASMTWAPTFARELLTSEVLAGSTVVLMDIDQYALEVVGKYVRRMEKEFDSGLTIGTTADRQEALAEADFVIVTFMAGGHDYWAKDLNIALKYGLQTPKGMSVGPGGLLQGLKAIPMIVEIAQEMEHLCPQAKLINYTNPMSSITLALQRYSSIPSAGVCTGPDAQVRHYSSLLGVPEDELEFHAAGVNHCNFVFEMRHQGQDLLPRAIELLAEADQQPISRLIYDVFGALPTPGDIHVMEFFPYFMRQNEDLAKWGQAHNYVEDRIARRKVFWQSLEAAADGQGDYVTSYEAQEKVDELIEALLFNRKRIYQLNVTNQGTIPNVLPEAVIEVDTVVDGSGFHPVYFGPLPTAIAGVCNMAATVQALTVEAAMSGSRQLALQALLMDPMVYSMEVNTVGEMLDEMLQAQKVWLPRFFN